MIRVWLFLSVLLIWQDSTFGQTTMLIGPSKQLIEITYHLREARTNAAPINQRYVLQIDWLSETHRGMHRFASVRGVTSSGSIHTNSVAEIKAAISAIEAISQSLKLPVTTNDIVIVRCVDDQKTFIRRFPIAELPLSLYDAIMPVGFDLEACDRVRFTGRPRRLPPIAPGWALPYQK